MFTIPITELIRRRRSIRTYDGQPLPAETRAAIERCFGEARGPFPVQIRFTLLDRQALKTEERLKLGTYGFILGATAFIAVAVERVERNMEQVGYVLEDLILRLTALDLGTCWLAGTFNKGAFAKACHLGADELLPAVTPVGRAGAIRGPIDILIKPVPGQKSRKPWPLLFCRDAFDTPLAEREAGAYALPLEMVRLAPSASNRQPWRILRRDGGFHFYLEHDPLYARRYSYDVQKIDLGIAMCHFEKTAREAGLKGSWAWQSPPELPLPDGLEYIATWLTK